MPRTNSESAATSGFVGRVELLARLDAVLEQALAGRAQLVLLAGETGIGKTAVASRLAEQASARGAVVSWGTSWDSERAPGFWPWTQALRGCLHDVPGALDELDDAQRRELARVVPELEHGPPADAEVRDPEQARFQLFDAVGALLEAVTRQRPAAIVLDDLHWADASSLELLEFVARPARPWPLMVVGAYRDDEVSSGTPATTLLRLAPRAETVAVTGLGAAEVDELVRHAASASVADRWATEVYRRTDGHPFFVRQLAQLLAASPGTPGAVPAAVRQTVEQRLVRLSPDCVHALDAAAVTGNRVLPDVLTDVLDRDAPAVADLLREALAGGVLTAGASVDDHPRFAHDLFRETLYARLTAPTRADLHRRVGTALERRHQRGATAFPGELARHFTAAIGLDGPDRAVRWAVAAADADRSGLAFAEAAGHIARVLRAAEDAGIPLEPSTMSDLLCLQADLAARAGHPDEATALLDRALGLARTAGDPPRLARAALGINRLGARFAMPRDRSIAVLEEARVALDGAGTALEAEVTADLARALSHSVPAERPRAQPLTEAALTIARAAHDRPTLAACLLARHDVLWGPGTASERLELASEITALAEHDRDPERRCEGVLLRANALLELGSPAFRPELARYLFLADGLHQPRHEYYALTRRAALALLDGDIDEGERLVRTAADVGASIHEPDEGNVRMSQKLGVVYARGDADALVAFADDAVAWWVGIPSHSHAVAAGFRARAGDLDGARRHLAVVTDLDTWRDDRSYMWSVFVGMMTVAAAALGERDLCAVLHEQLVPVADSCGVNGAVVCFMGSHAHWAGIAAGALGRNDEAGALLERALATHDRLGARAWAAETRAELARLSDAAPPSATAPVAVLRRDGELWEVGLGGQREHLRDVKGLHDLVVLLSRPGRDVPALELFAPGAPSGAGGAPVLDARARAEFRRRLEDLEGEWAEAERHHDTGRMAVLDEEREALVTELRAATGLGGRPRREAGDPIERARKAVSARIRDAIRRIERVDPALGRHLDRSVVTGIACRYEPADAVHWQLD